MDCLNYKQPIICTQFSKSQLVKNWFRSNTSRLFNWRLFEHRVLAVNGFSDQSSHIKKHCLNALQQIKSIIQTNNWGNFGPHKLVDGLHFQCRSTATTENVRRSWENQFTPSASRNSTKKWKRKQAAACERTTTSMSNTFRVFLGVPNAAKGLSTWGTQQDIETRVMFMCIANRPKSKPPQLPTSTSISISISISTSTLRCSELLFGRSVVRLASASRRSVQAEVLIHFLLLFHKYVFYSRGTAAP